MIIEFFYPKMLKEIIADLHAKDDLNEEPLKRKKGLITFSLCIITIVIPIMIIYNPHDTNYIEKMFLYILLPLSILIIYLDEYEKCKNFARLYNYGYFAEAICMQNRVIITLKGYKLEVSFYLDDGKQIMSNVKIPEDGASIWPFSKRFKNGKKITVCYDPENPEKAVVFSRRTANLMYLRKMPPPLPPT